MERKDSQEFKCSINLTGKALGSFSTFAATVAANVETCPDKREKKIAKERKKKIKIEFKKRNKKYQKKEKRIKRK